MAFTLNSFLGFETGGLEEVDGTANSPTVTSGGRSGSWHLNCNSNGEGVSVDPFLLISDAGDKYAVGFGYRTGLTATSGAFQIMAGREAGVGTMRVQEVRQTASTYKLALLDADNVIIGTAATVLDNGTWYFVEVYWENTDTGVAEFFIDGNQELSFASEDFTRGGSLGDYFFSCSHGAGSSDFDDIYFASGLTSASELYSQTGIAPFFEVFGYQNTVATAVPTAGLRATTKTNLDTGNWDDAGETPGTDVVTLTYDGAAEYGTVDLAGFGTEIDGDSNIKAIKGIWRAEYTGGGSAAHFIGLGDSGDMDSAADQSVTLTTSPTEYFWLRTTDLPTKAQSIRQGVANEGGRNLDFFEMWAMIAHVPAVAGTTTDKAISITFTTSMVNTTIKTGVKALNVGFATSMALERKTGKVIAVAFGTGITVAKKITPVTKAVAFVTAMVTTSVKTGFKAINIAFGTAFTLGKTTKLAKAVSFVTAFTVAKKVSVAKAVSFVTTMVLTKFKLVPKAIAVAFSTAFTVAKTVKVTKAVNFVTAMALTRVALFFRTITVAFGTAFANVRKTKLTKAVSFVTSMGLTRTSLFFRAFNVAFVTSMSLATLFIEGAQTFTKTINVAFVTTMSTTPVAVFVRVFNVTFTTSMSLAKTVRKNIAVVFVTAFSIARKVSVTKAVAFVTAFALTTTAFFARALSVSFITTMALTKTLSLSQSFSVAFVTSMSLVKKVLKTFTVGFSTGFGVTKMMRVVKQVPFVTSMALTTVSTRFKTLAVSFITTMVTTPSKIFIKSLAFGFVMVMSTTTLFFSGNILPTGAILLFLRRRRSKRDRR